jgi:predicted metal-dependent hydrolase
VRVWFEFINPFKPVPAEPKLVMLPGSRPVALHLVRHPRARRYRLRLLPDGTARVTLPPRGSPAEALRFVDRHRAWLEAQLHKLQAQPRHPAAWQVGTEILFRGEPVRIEAAEDGGVRVGEVTLQVADDPADLRPALELHLRRLAARELPARVMEFAARHQFPVRRVSVRNQKSRWGSCSRRGTISLNWRLIQAPEFVRDYIILHELAHLRHMNHSQRYWAEVERLCPGYAAAERWLKQHASLLR